MLPHKSIRRLLRVTPSQWLIVAAVLHLTLTLTIFLLGHFRLLPNHFDEHGIGISFAIDGVAYRRLAGEMAETLLHRGFLSWLHLQAPLHCRLYSLGFVFPGALLGNNILAAEPLNLLYYLGILTVVFLLGKQLFKAEAGLLAAVIIAVWPSFLLHSTQLLRDLLSIVLMLAQLFILVKLLKSELSLRGGVWLAAASVALIILFWLTRGNMWNIMLAALAISAVLLILRMLHERRFLIINASLLTVIFAAGLLVPTRIDSTNIAGAKPPTALIAIPSGPPANSRSLWTQMITQVAARRGGFSAYGGQASNIDANVTFHNAADILKYLPRAAIIGTFAPFPRMWFEVGSGGRLGRLVSGVETLMMYLFYVAAAICIWRERNNPGVWLFFLLSLTGMIALGLVVPNVGALYRLRFLFWILVIVLAVEGIAKVRGGQRVKPQIYADKYRSKEFS